MEKTLRIRNLKIKTTYYYGIGFLLAMDFNDETFYILLPFIGISFERINDGK